MISPWIISQKRSSRVKSGSGYNMHIIRSIFHVFSMEEKCFPWLHLSLKSRNITVDSQFEAPESVSEDDDVMQTGFLQYSATVVDTEIGKDQFTEVVIKPLHHLSDIYVTWVLMLLLILNIHASTFSKTIQNHPFRPIECRVSSGDSELFPMHSFDTDLCLGSYSIS